MVAIMGNATRRIALGAAACAVVLAGCGAVSPESQARDDAGDKASTIATEVLGTRVQRWSAEELGRRAADRKDMTLLAVAGTKVGEPGGVTLTIQVIGHGADHDFYGTEENAVDLPFCFELHFEDYYGPGPVRSVTCPDLILPVTFAPPPAPPRLPSLDQLRVALPPQAVDEASVKASLAKLDLDSRIRVEVSTRDGAVGVTLMARDELNHTYDCRFARILPGATWTVWRPASVQLQAGELACHAGEALAGDGMTPPH
jgi:hypothetical protein